MSVARIMPRSQLAQRYNAGLIRKNKLFDAEFCRLFWSPFADVQPVMSPSKRKRTRKRPATRGHRRCTVCSAVFRWPADLKYHIAYHHRGEKLNVCPVTSCRLNFQFPYQLTIHQRTSGHHSWQVVCKECSKRFAHRRFLARHTVASCNRYRLATQLANAYTANNYDDNVAT